MAKKRGVDNPFSYLENFFTNDPNLINLFNVLVRELANSIEEQENKAKFTVTISKESNPGQGQKEALQLQPKQVEVEPLVDVITDEKHISVIAEVPGVRKSEIKISYTTAALEISANEKENRKYFRQIPLPYHKGSRKINAKYTNGVLEVIMTKGRKINSESDIKID